MSKQSKKARRSASDESAANASVRIDTAHTANVTTPADGASVPPSAQAVPDEPAASLPEALDSPVERDAAEHAESDVVAARAALQWLPDNALAAPGGDRADHGAAVATPDAAAEERMQRQAAQLREYLQTRQVELDRRDAMVNARLAQLDRDLSAARLWQSEKRAELAHRAEALHQQENDLRAQLQRMAAENGDGYPTHAPISVAAREDAERMNELDRRAHVVAQAEATLKQRQAEFDRAQSAAQRELDAQRAALESDRSAVAFQAAALNEREERLRQGEETLAASMETAERLREQERAERQRAVAEMDGEREAIATQRRRSHEELERKRSTLERRAARVEQSRRALRQLRGELGHMHRETLEIRLATEELWAQLAGTAPPAALTHSLSRIRTRLADQYRLANTELQAQRRELEEIRGQLADQYLKLVQEKRQFDAWAAAHQEDTERQAARLVSREEAIRAQEAALEEQQYRWESDRFGLQREICRLRRELEGAAAA